MKPIATYCKECKGKCCSYYNSISFYYPELITLAYHFGTTVTKLKQQYSFKYDIDNEQYGIRGDPCPFFDSNLGKCSIYAIRPQTCITYPLIHHPEWKNTYEVHLRGLKICKFSQYLRQHIIDDVNDTLRDE